MDKGQVLIDFNEVKKKFSFSENTLRWLIRTRQIPGMVRVGQRRIFFNAQELEDWIEKNKIPVQNEKIKCPS